MGVEHRPNRKKANSMWWSRLKKQMKAPQAMMRPSDSSWVYRPKVRQAQETCRRYLGQEIYLGYGRGYYGTALARIDAEKKLKGEGLILTLIALDLLDEAVNKYYWVRPDVIR